MQLCYYLSDNVLKSIDEAYLTRGTGRLRFGPSGREGGGTLKNNRGRIRVKLHKIVGHGNKTSTSNRKTPASDPADEHPTIKVGNLQIKLILSTKNPFGVFFSGGRKYRALFATLELRGKAAAEATAYGFVQVKSAKDDQGKVLKSVVRHLSDDPGKGFVETDSGANEPLKIHFMLDPPLPTATHLAQLKGSLKLMTGGQRHEILVQDVLRKSRTGATVRDLELKQAGMRVKLRTPTKDEVMDDPTKAIAVEIRGPTDTLHEVALVDADGKKHNTAQGRGSFGNRTTITLETFEQKLPPDISLRLILVAGQKPLTVPFKFADVALPKKN